MAKKKPEQIEEKKLLDQTIPIGGTTYSAREYELGDARLVINFGGNFREGKGESFKEAALRLLVQVMDLQQELATVQRYLEHDINQVIQDERAKLQSE